MRAEQLSWTRFGVERLTRDDQTMKSTAITEAAA
jgi:hypothetical protein